MTRAMPASIRVARLVFGAMSLVNIVRVRSCDHIPRNYGRALRTMTRFRSVARRAEPLNRRFADFPGATPGSLGATAWAQRCGGAESDHLRVEVRKPEVGSPGCARPPNGRTCSHAYPDIESACRTPDTGGDLVRGRVPRPRFSGRRHRPRGLGKAHAQRRRDRVEGRPR